MTSSGGWRVLAVDDVEPAVGELRRMLDAAPEIGSVRTATDAVTALKLIQAEPLDVVFLDISMPGMDGMELASLLSRMQDPPVVVFVTAYEEHAADAFGIGAADYLLKPVRPERLRAALERVRRFIDTPAPPAKPAVDSLAAVPVELAGRPRFIRRDDVRADNTISSTRVADAQIAYTGTGALADANSMGWLTRFFHSVIFPF